MVNIEKFNKKGNLQAITVKKKIFLNPSLSAMIQKKVSIKPKSKIKKVSVKCW